MNDFDSAILNLKNKLGHKAPEKTYSFVSHAEAINHLQKIIQERLSIGYEIVSVEKENQVPILKEISASDRKQQSENEKILKLIGEIEVDTMNSISHSKRETNNLSEISVNQLENLKKTTSLDKPTPGVQTQRRKPFSECSIYFWVKAKRKRVNQRGRAKSDAFSEYHQGHV